MAGLIEKNARETYTLKQKSGITDGKLTFRDTVCSGFSFDFRQTDFTEAGVVRNGKVFLVCPLTETPEIPGKIVFSGKTYDIKSIRVIRTLSGVLWGYRIAAAGE